MPETLHTCPACGRANFTARGLRAHRCKAAGGSPAALRAPPAQLPTLSAAAVSARRAWDAVEEAARQFDRSTLADRLWIGCCCLVAQERHAMDAAAAGKRGGRGRKACLRVDELSTLSPDQAHPQGFQAWMANAWPWLPKPTAYKYIDAARGAGFTAWATEAEVREWVAARLAAEPALSLRVLIDAGRKLLPPPSDDGGKKPDNWQQLTFDALLGFRDHCESVISHRDHMTADQHRIAVARAYRVLRELTGSPWQPADEDVEEYVAILADADAGGL